MIMTIWNWYVDSENVIVVISTVATTAVRLDHCNDIHPLFGFELSLNMTYRTMTYFLIQDDAAVNNVALIYSKKHDSIELKF